jgi:transcriptional regulator with XRE-family HTH domain
MTQRRKDTDIAAFARIMEVFGSSGSISRPKRGWLRAMRLAFGISAGEVGRRMGTSRQLPLQFEKAEAEDSITLRSLRSMASALDFDLVYALVPKPGKASGMIADLKRQKERRASRKLARSRPVKAPTVSAN